MLSRGLLKGTGAKGKDHKRRVVHARLLVEGTSKVRAALIEYADRHNWKRGWAAFAFKEIFGAWPPRDRGPDPKPLEGYLIEEWVAYRKKRPRIKAKNAAPLLAEVEKPVVQVDASGNVVGTYMKPEDFEVEWR